MSIKQDSRQKSLCLCTCFFIFTVILLMICAPSAVRAHKVNIFAYAEGDKIFTESYFNDGSPCKGSLVQVFAPDGRELLQGRTDEKGIFNFGIPQRTDLRIVMTASMGHKAEYRMPVSELPDMPDQKMAEQIQSTIPQAFSEKGKAEKIADQNVGDVSSQPVVSANLEQIRSVVEGAVDEAIERKMKPLIHAMAKAQSNRVSLTDIIGGIGYIFGIMGLILYFKKKEK